MNEWIQHWSVKMFTIILEYYQVMICLISEIEIVVEVLWTLRSVWDPTSVVLALLCYYMVMEMRSDNTGDRTGLVLSLGSQPLNLYKEITCNARKVKQSLKLFLYNLHFLNFFKRNPPVKFLFFHKSHSGQVKWYNIKILRFYSEGLKAGVKGSHTPMKWIMNAP